MGVQLGLLRWKGVLSSAAMKIAYIWTILALTSYSCSQLIVDVPVKRVHSRQRRFIAPGALWTMMIGVEAIGSDYEFRYDILINYNMDYLFGGSAALAGAIASANAAAMAASAAKAAAEAVAGKRKKRSGSAGANVAASFGGGRSFSTSDDIGNVLKRTIVDDQIDVLGKIEAGLDKGGLAGRQCVLRAICELSETPIHHWTVFGEMINNLLRPKNGTHEALEDYKRAEKIGEEQGDCWSFYPDCPISIFNVIPDVYTTDDQVQVTFDGFDAGSKFDANGGNDINEEIMNMIKDEMKVKKHNIDIDFTT